jgi:hypothetical protein
MRTIQIAMILLYRIVLVGTLMYTVGYLDWSAHWLWLLLTMPYISDDEENK